MNSRIRVFFYAMMIVSVTLVNAFSVIPARADDGAPPPPAAPASPAGPGATSPAGVVLSAVSTTGTDVVVIDRRGHKAALATQAAADIMASGDPIWCPNGVAPIQNIGGCTGSFQTFNGGGLLAHISGKTVNGTIWIDPAYAVTILEGAVIFIDGSTLGSTTNRALTINGGWTGTAAGVLDPLAPSTFTIPLTINWHAAVTVNDVTITGAAGNGLQVMTAGNIILNNITSVNNAGDGAYLDSQGTVTVNDSTFNNNTGDGLNAWSDRAISGKNITAVNNNWDGAYLDNELGLVGQPVTLTGTNNFSHNGINGLEVYTRGTITVSDVTASYNSGTYGAYLDNCKYDTITTYCDYPGPYSVTLNGSNNFSNNNLDGLAIYASGALTVNNITANDNGSALLPSGTDYYGVGALLDNYGAYAPRPLTLTGTNTFNGNGAAGSELDSFGLVKVNNVTANGNGLDPNCLPAWNCNGMFVPHTDSTGFTLTGYGTFNGNGDDGLSVATSGPILLTTLTAESNGMYGAYLDNTFRFPGSNITLTGTNNTSGNQITGLYADSNGSITVNGLTSNNNVTGYGADLRNNHLGVVGTITVNGGIFYNNGIAPLNILSNVPYKYISAPVWCPTGVAPGGAGCSTHNYLSLQDLVTDVNSPGGFHPAANGVIWIQNATFSSLGTGIVFDSGASSYMSTWSGFSLTLQGGWSGPGKTTLPGSPSVIQDSLTITNWHASVTLNDIVITGVTSGTALTVNTTNSITLMRVNVHGNSGAGASLTNSGGTGTVTVSSSNFSNNTGGDGLDIYSRGVITLNDVSANSNTAGEGIHLENILSTTSAGVTFTGTNTFSGNNDLGLDALSKGAITLGSVTADGNGNGGAVLNNSTATGAMKVTFSAGMSEFNNNTGGDGLDILSRGTITLKDVSASTNTGGLGAHLENVLGSTAAGVTLSGTNIFSENDGPGLEVWSNGAIKANNLIDNSNLTYGAWLDNCKAYSNGGLCLTTTAMPVTLTGSSQFKFDTVGLMILTSGAVSMNGITASNSSAGAGVKVNNTTSTVASGVTMTGTNILNENNDAGLVVFSKGPVTLNNINASGNGYGAPGTGYGVDIENNNVTAPKPVTLNGTNTMNGNLLDGLHILTKGAITLTNITARLNGGDDGVDPRHGLGASLDNYTGNTFVQPVTLKGTNTFDANYSGGLNILSLGAITVNNTEASNNNSFGASFDNNHPLMVGGVTLTGYGHFNNNISFGLNVATRGTITLNNLVAGQNTGDGAQLNNTFGSTGSPKNVTLTGASEFSTNGDTGLEVESYGMITLNNISAHDNGTNHGSFGWGAYLDNCGYTGSFCTSGIAPKAITLTGTNSFNNNDQDGLWATTWGAIKVNALTADNNHLDGGYLFNQWGSGSLGGITLTGTNEFNGNGAYGLDAFSQGAITMNNVTASSNTHGGARLNTFGLLLKQNVTLTGSNTFSDNMDGFPLVHLENGLEVHADGNITVSNLTAGSNDGNGAILDNCLLNGGVCLGSGSLTLTGINTFNGNSVDGLYSVSHKNVILNSVNADNNSSVGVYVHTDGTLLVSCGSMTNNGSYGWELKATPTVTLKAVFAFGNNSGSGNTLLDGGTLLTSPTCP